MPAAGIMPRHGSEHQRLSGPVCSVGTNTSAQACTPQRRVKITGANAKIEFYTGDCTEY